MLTFVVIYREGGTPILQVAIQMRQAAAIAHGTWTRLVEGSTATLAFDQGTWDQTAITGPVEECRFSGPDGTPFVSLSNFLPAQTNGSVHFPLTEAGGTFGTDDAMWRRLEA